MDFEAVLAIFNLYLKYWRMQICMDNSWKDHFNRCQIEINTMLAGRKFLAG